MRQDTVVEVVTKRKRGSRLPVVLGLPAALAAVALWVVPMLQVAPARERLALSEQIAPADRLVLENQLFDAENAARSTLALILAGAGILLGGGIIWRRYEQSRELKSHERFAAAVEQLGAERADGSPRTEARLAGIYALEQLILESEREYWPVMEVLTAYVRENAPARKSTERSRTAGPVVPPADVQAVLAVLGRRRVPHSALNDKRLLDLRETDLHGANLSGIRLDGVTLFGAQLGQADATRASFSRSNLREANLAGASFTEVNLEGASLSKVSLEGARLNGANLKGCDLSGANLRGADLWEADLTGSNLKDADLRGADLSQCVLEAAILWRADLQDAVLTGARLRETHLERANLAGVTGLTWEQGEDAFTDENTILPHYLAPESGRTVPQVTPPPTPASRRAPTRATAKTPTPTTTQAPPPPAATEPRDNVVQLNRPAAKRPRADVKSSAAEASPKKASLPRRRKPGLVKPA